MTPSVAVTSVRLEHVDDALGIGVSDPRVSWKLSAPSGWIQAEWEISVRRKGEWQHATGSGADQLLVPWPFAPLASRERFGLRVRARSDDGEWSAWSDELTGEAALLSAEDWLAIPVGGNWPEEPASLRRPSHVRREFSVRSDLEVVSARLYATAHGLFEGELNGVRIGDHEFAPGWTSYDHRLTYWTYDVTSLLEQGKNVLGAWLADGWYRGRLGFNGGAWDLYGTDLSFIGQLEITYSDGSRDTIATDGSWEAKLSPILSSSLYDGEKLDSREENALWSTPHGERTGWTPVATGVRDPRTLVPAMLPPVRVTEDVAPVSIVRLHETAHLIDFGQNLVGRLRVRVHGTSGTVVELRHAEVLENGHLGTRPLRRADATDSVILDGRPEWEWEPRFTFHGFRYATVEGLADIAPDDVVARVIHSDMARTGWLETSSADLNRLHENVRWGMRGNFLSIPTDCPQRDERLGWTGDIQVFAPTASFLYDSAAFLESWLEDVAIEQLPDGTVPWFVPDVPGGPTWNPIRTGAVWGDVAVLTPWTLYERFGDVGVLGKQWDSAQKWVERMVRESGDARLWREGQQLGDWLDPAAPPDDPAAARTDRYLVASAYFAHSSKRLADTALVLGRQDDAERYGRIADEVRDAFRAEYVTSDNRLSSDAQTAYALAIRFGLLTRAEQDASGQRLAELVAAAGNRIATGFAGTPVIADALSQTGHVSSAYDLLLEDSCPSWLYTVRMGGTTIWERWDSMLPDGTINPGEMTSFNHYALGSVADWMHRVIGGLSAAAPGYRRIRWAPVPGGGLTSARLRFESPYGRIDAEWKVVDDATVYTLAVPTGVSGVAELPGCDPVTVESGGRVHVEVPRG